MKQSHLQKEIELDDRAIEIRFSSKLRNAFTSLAAAAHFSPTFDPLMLEIVRRWGGDEPQILHDYLVSLPTIADETFRHIRQTNDEKAQEAWGQICGQVAEKGFVLTQKRVRGK